MPRVLGVVLALLLVTCTRSFAQESSPVASPMTAVPAGPPDLAAMVLLPSQMPDPNYSLASGSFMPTAAVLAESMIGHRGASTAEIGALRDRLEDASYEYRYDSWLELADPVTGELQRTVTSYIELYADEAGAEEGFDAIADAVLALDSSAELVEGSRAIGTRSVLMRFVGSGSATPTPDQPAAAGIDLGFRLGTLNAGVAILDFTGDEPSVEEVENLAATLQANIERAMANEGGRLPGLSNLVSRLAGTDVVGKLPYEAYHRLGGIDVPFFGFTLVTMDEPAEFSGTASDAYLYDLIDLESPAMTYLVWLLQFPSAEAAEAWVPHGVDTVRSVYPGLIGVTPVVGAPVFGDYSETVTTSYYQEWDGEIAWGTMVFGHVGDVGFMTWADSTSSVPEEAIGALVEAQVACLQRGGDCPLVSLELLPELDGTAPATPAA